MARTASSSGVPACFTTDLLAIVAPAARLSAKQPESCQQQLNNVQRHMTGLTRLSLNRDGQLENAHPNIHVAPSQVVSQLPHRPSMQPIRTGSSGGEQKRPQLPCTASTQHLYGETSVEEMPDQWSVHRGGHRRLCSQQEALDSLQLVAKQWSPVSTSRCGP